MFGSLDSRRRRTSRCRPTAAHFVVPRHSAQRGPRRLSYVVRLRQLPAIGGSCYVKITRRTPDLPHRDDGLGVPGDSHSGSRKRCHSGSRKRGPREMGVYVGGEFVGLRLPRRRRPPLSRDVVYSVVQIKGFELSEICLRIWTPDCLAIDRNGGWIGRSGLGLARRQFVR